MIRFYRYVFALLLVFLILPVKSPKIFAYGREDASERYKELRWTIRKSAEQFKYLAINKVTERLEIRPGMTILDIGTGTGQYACELAKRLSGTGRVFTADIDAESLNYVKQKADEEGITNLYPVMVNEKGIDEFYGKHKYDLIFLAHVYMKLYDRVEYFKTMRRFLAENGRLVIFDYKGYDFKFSPDDITDFENLIGELSLEPEDGPFYKNFEPTRKLVRRKAKRSRKLLETTVVNDFNKILLDPGFCANFLKDGSSFKEEMAFSPEETEYAGWLLEYLKAMGTFNGARGQKDLIEMEVKWTALLNKLLIIQRFRQYLFEGGPSPYLSKDNQDNDDAAKIKNELEAAGYILKNEYNDVMPFKVMLFFTANKSGENESGK